MAFDHCQPLGLAGQLLALVSFVSLPSGLSAPIKKKCKCWFKMLSEIKGKKDDCTCGEFTSQMIAYKSNSANWCVVLIQIQLISGLYSYNCLQDIRKCSSYKGYSWIRQCTDQEELCKNQVEGKMIRNGLFQKSPPTPFPRKCPWMVICQQSHSSIYIKMSNY